MLTGNAKTDYSRIRPLTLPIEAERQLAKRHYGVHPYFTRRPPNVVRAYIEHYTRPGDRVLDPFGGSGVTAIEAFLAGRTGIQNDINPLGNFMAEQIADTSRSTVDYIRQAFDRVDADCGDVLRRIPGMPESEVKRRLRDVSLPENIILPKNSDVDRFCELFTPRQLLALALLKSSIDGLVDPAGRGQLLLAWSATLAKLNRTFLSAKGRLESRGGSSIFSIYRYKVAKSPVELPPWQTFEERVGNTIKAKEEVLREIQYLKERGQFAGTFECFCEDARNLPRSIKPVDYIFTDPPYGGHIAYLDLSTLWNHWLGFRIPEELRRKEIIVGGELDKSDAEYLDGLRASIEACFKLLKDQRWISIVFQHWNIAYFEAILETADASSGVLRSAVTQVGDTIWSMHKKKNRERVLAGEMILSFYKDSESKRRPAPKAGSVDIDELVDSILPLVAGDESQLHGEILFNRLITEAWKRNSLRALRISREDFISLLRRRGWFYSPQNHCWMKDQSTVEAQRELW